jgi:hypothetical protein
VGIGKDVLGIGLRLAGAFGAGLQDLAHDALTKAEGETQETGPGGRDKDTAEANPVPDKPAKEDPKSLMWDPYAIVEQLGFKDRPSQITYGTLRAIVRRMPVVGAVINTRIDQLAGFCVPQENRFQVGFRVKLRDSKRSPTKVERKWTEQMEQLLLRTGVTKHPRGRDSLETFIRKLAFDSLTFDQDCFEVVPDRKGRPCEWYAVDAATIRLADQQGARMDEDTDATRYVQVYDGLVISEYAQSELAWGIRHPRTDIRLYGYGESELEQMITAITSLLCAWEYNQRAFSQGSSAKGILNFKGKLPGNQLEQFRRHWYMMLSGVENCVAGDTALWTPRGAVSVEDLLAGEESREETVWVGDGWKSALVYRTAEPKLAVKTVLGNGVSLMTSPNHKFRVIGDDGDPTWKQQADLQIGDFVLVNKCPVETEAAQLPVLGGKEITPDLMEVLGWFVGDGCLVAAGKGRQKPNYAQWFYHSTKERDICARHVQILQEFERSAHVKEICLTAAQVDKIREKYGFHAVQSTQLRVEIFNRGFVFWLLANGFTPSSKGKSIPGFVHTLPIAFRAAFLRGLFSADGNCARHRNPLITIADHRVRGQVRLLLLSLGIRTCLSEGRSKIWIHNRDRGVVLAPSYLKVKDKDRFFTVVGFIQAHKQPRSVRKVNEAGKSSRVAHATVLKYLRLVRSANDARGKHLLPRRQRMGMNSILTGQDGCSLPRLLRFLRAVGISPPAWLTSYHFEPVVEIEQSGKSIPMFDLEVRDSRHQFCASGVMCHNSWRTPITNAEDLQWISMQANNRDMEYNAWMDFLLKVVCSFYSMDPSEINFKYGNVGQKSGLSEDSNAEKISESRERGLRPLLKHFSDQFNRNIIWPTNESFEFEFVGLDSMTRDKAADLATKQVKSIRTVDELRAEDDLDPLPDGKGEVILDNVWMQFAQQKDAATQQEEQGGAPGGLPGGAGGPPGAEGAPPPAGGAPGAPGGQPGAPGGQGGAPGGQQGAEQAPDFEQLLGEYERPAPEEGAKSLTAGRARGPLASKIVLDLDI